MIQVHEAFGQLEDLVRDRRPFLARAMSKLERRTRRREFISFLDEVQVDAFDLWIGYRILGVREQSRTGRDNCMALASLVGSFLVPDDAGPGFSIRRGKDGTLLLWSTLLMAMHGEKEAPMYRNALSLLVPGHERFRLTETGPISLQDDLSLAAGLSFHPHYAQALRFAPPERGDRAPRPPIVVRPASGFAQNFSLTEQMAIHKLEKSGRATEIRDEVRIYFTGDRTKDISPFLAEERLVALDEWERITEEREEEALLKLADASRMEVEELSDEDVVELEPADLQEPELYKGEQGAYMM